MKYNKSYFPSFLFLLPMAHNNETLKSNNNAIRTLDDPYHLYSWISKTIKLQTLKELISYSHDINDIRKHASEVYNSIKPPCRNTEKKSICDLINTSKRSVCLHIMNEKNLFSCYEDILIWIVTLEKIHARLSEINKDIVHIINNIYISSESFKLES